MDFENDELKLMAMLYFTSAISLVGPDGTVYEVNRGMMKEVLDSYGIDGWNEEKNTYTTKIQG